MDFDFHFFDDLIYKTLDLHQNDINLSEGFAQKKVFVATPTALNTQEADFLAQIFKAVKIEMSEWVAFGDAKMLEGLSWSSLERSSNFEQLIFFGTLPQDFGLQIQLPLYQPRIFEHKTLLRGDTLSTIQKDTQKKRLLWGALQQIFLP